MADWLPRRNSIADIQGRTVKGPSARLIVCHCFSERLIKVRKYGLGVGRAALSRINDGDTLRVEGWKGAEGSCGIATKISGPLYQL